MTFVRTITMLALAQEALDRFENNADAAQVYLLELLRSDNKLLETLVRSAVEYERQERLHSSVGGLRVVQRQRCPSLNHEPWHRMC